MVAGLDQHGQMLLDQRMLHDLGDRRQCADADLRPFQRDAGQLRDVADVHQRVLELDPPRLGLRGQVGAAGEYGDIAVLEALDRLVEAGGCEVVLQFGHVGILRFMVVNAAFNDETRHSGLDPESSGLFLDTGVRRYDELEGIFHINRVRTGSVPGSARIH